MITEQDLSVKKGDDKPYHFTHSDDGGAVNLTGYVIMLHSSSEYLEQEAVITDAANGKYSITFDRSNTDMLTRSAESYEVAYYSSGIEGPKTTKFKGSILVELS